MLRNHVALSFLSWTAILMCAVTYAAEPDFDQWLKDLGSDDFATRERAEADIKKLITPKQTLTKEQVSKLQSAAISDDAEVAHRGSRLLSSFVNSEQFQASAHATLQFIEVRTTRNAFEVGTAIDPAFILRPDAMNNPSQGLTIGILDQGYLKVKNRIDRGAVTEAAKALDEFEALIKDKLTDEVLKEAKLTKDDVNGTPLKQSQLLQMTQRVREELEAVKQDAIKQGLDPNARAVKTPVNQKGMIDLGKSLQLALGGLLQPGALEVLAPTSLGAISIPPLGFIYVGPIFDIVPADALIADGEIRLGIEYGPFQLVNPPVLDPASLQLVRIANGQYDFLGGLFNDLGSYTMFGSYFASSSDIAANLNQFGEFAIVQAVPEPATILLLALAMMRFLVLRRDPAQRKRRRPGKRGSAELLCGRSASL